MSQNLDFVAPATTPVEPRHNWQRDEVEAMFNLPFNDLIFQAQSVHRQWFDANEVQKSTLLSIKTGGCPEDCGYCSQSSKFETGLKASKLLEVEAVLEGASRAKAAGASRYCMGAPRRPHAIRRRVRRVIAWGRRGARQKIATWVLWWR